MTWSKHFNQVPRWTHAASKNMYENQSKF